MKTAKELSEKYYNEAVDWGGRRSDHLANMEYAMKEYADKALDEQRKICEDVYRKERCTNLKSSVESIANDIRNAPKPELK